jgi:hypothetical protein
MSGARRIDPLHFKWHSHRVIGPNIQVFAADRHRRTDKPEADMQIRRVYLAFLSAFVLILFSDVYLAQEKSQLTVEQQREFLLNAEVIRARQADKGTTNSYRLTLSDGKIMHDANFQSINKRRHHKGGEINFVDSYLYNIAAYELAKLICLDDMLPTTIERKWRGNTGSMSWWLPVQMDERTRVEKNMQPPNFEAWNNSMLKILVFTELIFDTDRSRENVLIGNNWELYMIDFTRAFRLHHFLMNPKSLLRCSRELLENLCALDAEKLEAKVSKYLTNLEFEDILKRRDKLVSHFEKLIAEKGEDEVLN